MTLLNQNELEALRILWEHGELKPAEIQSKFSWPIENATLRSVLACLVEEEHVSRRMQGKAFFYAAKIPKRNLLASMTDSLARIFAGGSHQELVLQLMETSRLKPGDVQTIQQIASGKNSGKTKGRKT